jgi:dihydrofolate reductase
MNWVLQNVTGGFLLGRRTFQGFASHWPKRVRGRAPLAEPEFQAEVCGADHADRAARVAEFDSAAGDDVGDAVAALKGEDGGDLLVIGSTKLVQRLLGQDLVDEFRVMIDPPVLGGGKRVVPDDGTARPLRRTNNNVSTTRSIIASYAAGPA